MIIIRILICLLTLSSLSFANEEFKQPVSAHLIMEETSIQPGRPFWVGIEFTVDDHWHTYWQNPGDSGMPLTVDWLLPAEWTVDAIQWPHPQKFESNTLVGYGYEGNVLLLAKVTPPANIPTDTKIKLAAQTRWVACSDDTCLPGNQDISLEADVSKAAPAINPTLEAQFRAVRQTLPQTLEQVKATFNDELVEVSLQLPYSVDPDAKVQFFGFDSEGIDAHFDPTLVRTDVEGSHKMALREVNPQARVSGVLVIEQQGQKLAYHVDAPVAGREDSLIGLAGTPESEIAYEQMLPVDYHSDVDTLGWALIFAFVGGLLLNLMPCVLPVISFKVMSFVKMAGESRLKIFKHGAAFSMGVIVSFWALAGLLLILQAYGQAVGWGFQLQEPLFVAVLTAVIFVFGLSLFGVFELGTSVTAWAGDAQHSARGRGELAGSFFSGVLATAVATPCTGPFLGSAVGFAFTLPAWQALLIFTFLGLGMSLPYLLFAAFPSLMRLMPKPGAWMETFKQLMGFLMMATVIWLAWVFGAQTGSNGVVMMSGSLFLMAFGCWIYGQWGTPMQSKKVRLVSTCATVFFLLWGGYGLGYASNLVEAPSSSTEIAQVGGWETFSPQRVEELRAQGVPVLIDFTAKWCLICQTNHLVLDQGEVESKMNAKGVVRMKADWTRHDPVITEELRKFGRNSVPLYVLYNGDGQPKILPQVLTSESVLDHLRDVEQVSR